MQEVPEGDDDDDLDLFGDETEEEKKAAEEREAAVKASSKKKESKLIYNDCFFTQFISSYIGQVVFISQNNELPTSF